MKRLLAATSLAISLSMLAMAPAHAGDASAPTGTEARPHLKDAQAIIITRRGAKPSSQGPAQYFTGSARIDPLLKGTDPAQPIASYVTFAPGARTAWHTHPLGQLLIVTSGIGRVQRWGGPVEEIRPGDVVWIPPHVKHWHGATPNSAMTHIAILSQVNGKNADWMEKVSDAQYKR